MLIGKCGTPMSEKTLHHLTGYRTSCTKQALEIYHIQC